MHPRIQEILHCLETEMTNLRAAVDSVPVERRSERVDASRWSVAEVLEHLAMVEQAVLEGCAQQLKAARDAGIPPETDTSSIISLLPTEHVANRDRRITAPERLRPTGIDAETAWRRIEQTRAEFVELVRGCDGLALAAISFPHPAFGPLNMYQWMLFAAGHQARHAGQIREIAQQLAQRGSSDATSALGVMRHDAAPGPDTGT